MCQSRVVFSLPGEQIYDLESGRFGVHVPAHILMDLAEDHGISLNMKEYEEIIDGLKVLSHCVSHA